MTTLKLQFSGHIKKVQVRQAGTKTVAEVQLCKKVPGKNGEPDAFTWVKATIWEPKDWQQSKLLAGAYISGCGDFAMRSYTKTDGTKGVSAEVRCSSFDIDMPDERVPVASHSQEAVAPVAVKPVSNVHSDPDIAPF
jgi:hypothetical protein